MRKERLKVPARVRRFADEVAGAHGHPPPVIEYVEGNGGGRGKLGWMRLSVARRNGRKIECVLSWSALKCLIVHEATHGFAPAASHHDATFWKMFWVLVRHHRISYSTALQRTSWYKVEGVRQAALAEIPGAQALLDAHQRALNRGVPGFLGRSHRCLYGDILRIEPPNGGSRIASYAWWTDSWRLVRRCVGLRWRDQPCNGMYFEHHRTEGQARAAMLEPAPRETQAL